ncbi:MAG: hypothetical protein L0099_15465 [Acidobacteria bacterium]|nr:hypothetical protein [Acidobacteriota bacterium]
MSMQAIETWYNGHLFRSRLEARWAVWLDTLGIKYAYEFQGFSLDGEAYLPDFWLSFQSGEVWAEGTPPVAGYYLEIKPAPLTDHEEKLLSKLAQHTRHGAIAFAGDPWPGEFAIHWASLQGDVSFNPPTLCPWCKGSGIYPVIPDEREWRGKRFEILRFRPCSCRDGFTDAWLDLTLHGFFCNLLGTAPDREQVTAAFQRARSARFEHGEHP